MAVQVNIAEAKAKLSELVARAERGEEVVIARYGKPVVTLSAKAEPSLGRPQRGVWAFGTICISGSILVCFFGQIPNWQRRLTARILPEA